MIQHSYRRPDQSNWKGRKVEPDQPPQYWYQHVELRDMELLSDMSSEESVVKIALLGYACDEGVARNQGRIGASDGPMEIRRQLAKLAFHHDGKHVFDLGEIICEDGQLEKSHEALADTISKLLDKKFIPIVMGGGHDLSYAHFNGIKQSLNLSSENRIGIINFDAHFDLRKTYQLPHSGTPFYQILSENHKNVGYFVVGLQKQSNPTSLFSTAEKYGVEYLYNDDCSIQNMPMVLAGLLKFIDAHDALYVTIDLDVISSAFAPGVSAPSPIGIDPMFLLKTLASLIETKKCVSYDIVELNPTFDRDGMTAGLASRIVDFIVGEL